MHRSFIALALAVFAAQVCTADPYVGYIYPAGLQAGTTNRVMIGGQGFWGRLSAGVSGEGVHVLGVDRMVQSAPPTGSQRVWLRTWLDGIIQRGDRTRPAFPTNAAARVGEWTLNAWWKTLDQLGRRELAAVEHDIFGTKNVLQMTPSLRQVLFVDIAVDADAPPGRRELCVWTSEKISPPRPFLVTSVPHVEEPLYTPPHRAQPPPPVVSSFPVVLDGRIMPGETDRFDLVLRKGDRLSCAVTARELQPYVGDAVPGFFNAVVKLKDAAGREIAFADDCDRFRPDPAFAAVVPADGTYRLEIHDNLFRGREDFVYSMQLAVNAPPSPVAGSPTMPDAGFSLWSPSTWFRSSLVCGGSVKGVLAPGGKDVYEVKLEGPGAYIFDLRARRDGSSLDGVLTLRDEQGDVVWRQDDVTNVLFVGAVAQAECDAMGRIELAAGERKRFSVTVEDLTGHGGPNYGYELALRREEPGFAVYAGHSALVSRLGMRQTLPLHIVRTGGFTGPVTLLEAEDFRFENGLIPAGTNEYKAVFIGKTRKELPLRPVRIRAFAEPDGVPKVVDVVPTDEYMQAFAWRHLLPASSFLVKNLPPWLPRVPPLKSSDTLLLVGDRVTPGLVRNLRLLLDLRRPYRAPDVAVTNALPQPLPKVKTRLLLLTPMPYDQYGDQRTPNLHLNTGARQAEAAAVWRLAVANGLPLSDLHFFLTPILRERVEMRLCGEDRQSPTPELELLAAVRIMTEALGEAPDVTRVTIDAVTGKEDVLSARIREVNLSKTGGSFIYSARALPLPATPVYRKVDAIFPLTSRLNRETLAVTQLAAGSYSLRFDGVEVGVFLAAELAKGVNVALLDTPGQRRAQAVAAKVGKPDYAPLRPRPVRVELVPKAK